MLTVVDVGQKNDPFKEKFTHKFVQCVYNTTDIFQVAQVDQMICHTNRKNINRTVSKK